MYVLDSINSALTMVWNSEKIWRGDKAGPVSVLMEPVVYSDY